MAESYKVTRLEVPIGLMFNTEFYGNLSSSSVI